ncbi:flagellar biosynthetic protein FliP [Candidatus Photodesmus katoptron Akat1]|uniref:Flagellar biosynthetic protein FliP n=1 Tax=Candidatus Photodesmus katoptron Akat1 TaxID=1236703 RepID=S3DL81_9GAMM|nr:flagellar biosynthetic protein FliP [Candidatus Photodesmus katoptron Akat1]
MTQLLKRMKNLNYLISIVCISSIFMSSYSLAVIQSNFIHVSNIPSITDDIIELNIHQLKINTGIPAFTIKTNPNGGEDYSINLQIIALMTILSFLPAMVILMTSFTRIVVVMSILRQAIGLQQTPSNQVIIGIAIFLTFFIMSPVLNKINEEAIQPYINEQISSRQAFEIAQKPMKNFMLKQTRIKDLETFVNIANSKIISPEEVSMPILIPAFITSELKTAFQIGFMLFLPFLIIDLVIASVLMAMGMMMLSPMIVSLPFKLMLFVLVDGWNLILSTLVGSFAL